jgi:hypothetical protein
MEIDTKTVFGMINTKSLLGIAKDISLDDKA